MNPAPLIMLSNRDEATHTASAEPSRTVTPPGGA
jgi:hypothetical protein